MRRNNITKSVLSVSSISSPEVLGLILYSASQVLYMAVLVIFLLEGEWVAGGLLLAGWLVAGAAHAIQLIWRDSSQPGVEMAVMLVSLTVALPVCVVVRCVKGLVKGTTSPEYGLATFSRWRTVLACSPMMLCLQGGLLLSSWSRAQETQLVMLLQAGSVLVLLADLVVSGAAWSGCVRESDPIIWYRPVEEGGRQGSFLERVMTAVTAVLQVEYGATQPGSSSRLPVVGKLDQRVLIKRSGMPTLLYIPTTKEMVGNAVPVFIHVLYRITALVLLGAYLQAYTLIPVLLITSLAAMAAMKMSKLELRDSLASAWLSFGLPATSLARNTPLPHIRGNVNLLNTGIHIIVIFISLAVLLSTASYSSPLPLLSCSNQTTTEIPSRVCQDSENPHSLLSIVLAVCLGLGLMSLLVSILARKRSMARLEVVPRLWSERHKSYQETEKVVVPGWRLATVKEVEERKDDLLQALKATTINIYRISKTQGLAVPHCKLQDGVIVPKNSYNVVEDIETMMTGEDQFKTFDNLYGLRFTRYVVIIKEKY